MIDKIRTFADIGRAQGIAVTGSVAICGALSSTANVEWYHIIYFTLIAIFLHTALNTYIAIGDIKLDAKTYTPERNPVISGKLSLRASKRYVIITSILGFLVSSLFFITTDWRYILPSFISLFIAYIWLIWYGYYGKRVLFSYDFSFSFSYGFFVLFGVFSVGGNITIYTWVFILITIFATTAFAQWENGLKDVFADRLTGVKSFAVITNVRSYQKLGIYHPYTVYGIFLKTATLFSCYLAFLISHNIYYLIFLIIYGISTQSFILWRFVTHKKPVDHRKTILYDVSFTGVLVYSVLIGKIGAITIILLFIYLICGYLVGSALQSECEFKFRRF